MPIFLATLAVQQKSQTVRFRTAAEMLESFGDAHWRVGPCPPDPRCAASPARRILTVHYCPSSALCTGDLTIPARGRSGVAAMIWIG